MAKKQVEAWAAGWAAQAIRDALPTDSDFADAELNPAERAEVIRELERLANQLLATAMRLEASGTG